MKIEDRHPLACGDEFERWIAVEVGPFEVGDHADFFKITGHLCGRVGEFPGFVFQDHRAAGIAINFGKTAAEANIEVAVSVKIVDCNGLQFGRDARQSIHFTRKIALSVIDIKPRLPRDRVRGLVAAARDNEIKVAVARRHRRILRRRPS